MKKSMIMALASAITLTAFPVSAQPSWPLTYSGFADVRKAPGPILNCPFDIVFNNTTDVTVVNTSVSGPCATFTINSNPHAYTYNHTTGALSVSGFDVTTTLTPGNCFGTLHAIKLNGVLTINNSALVGGLDANNNPTGDCTVEGVFERD